VLVADRESVNLPVASVVVHFLASGPSRISIVASLRTPDPCSVASPAIAASAGTGTTAPSRVRAAVLVPPVCVPVHDERPS